MAKYLYKLGKLAANNSKKIIGGSILILLVIAIIAMNLGSNFSEDMSIPGSESEKALHLIKKEFPSNTSQVQLVFNAPENKTLDSEEINNVITDTLKVIKEKDSYIVSVASPLELGNINKDKNIGYAIVTYNVAADKVSEKSKKNIIENIENIRDAGIQTELSGDVSFSEMEIGGITEVIGVIVAFVILAITFISLLAAGLPIITAVIGLATGIFLIMIGTNYLDITSVSITLAAMLGLAVGIDYALFIMTRFRQQRKEGYSVQESVAIANGTAGSAVVFAGITVIIALLGLSVAKIPFLTMMGLSAALCVLFAIFIAIIVVPAFLGLLGHKVGPDRKNSFLSKIIKRDKKQTTSDRWGNFVAKRPWEVAIIGITLLSIIAIPISHMELALPDNGSKSEETTERRAYDLLTKAYGPGHLSTLIVAAKTSSETTNPQVALSDIIEELNGLSNVKNVSPAIPGPSGELYLISITPDTGAADSETKDLVNDIREKAKTLEKSNHIKLMVTGTTAVNIDISQKLSDALPIFALLIIGFSFILLVLVFRSILVPLKAVLGFVLSLGATLGFTVFVIQDGNLIDLFGFPIAYPILSFLPVIVIGILFGLAMDYEVFLVSRMREVFTHTGDARKAVLAGMKDSGGVVTAAGLIMISVFTGFMLAPDPIIKAMGFSLTFGVIFDAFVVRMAIVPAVMILMGKASWYLPKWLDKLLPNLDIEGESFMKEKKEIERKRN